MYHVIYDLNWSPDCGKKASMIAFNSASTSLGKSPVLRNFLDLKCYLKTFTF